MNAGPPKLSPSLLCCAGLLLALTGMGVGALVYCFNPSTHHFYPVCEFHRLTGLNCPGCGGTRALYALLHGDLVTALRDNALAVVGLAGTGLRAGWFALNRLRGRRNGDFFPARYLAPLLIVMAVFGVLRNLPAFNFLSP
jgi:hypothetical protein